MFRIEHADLERCIREFEEALFKIFLGHLCEPDSLLNGPASISFCSPLRFPSLNLRILGAALVVPILQVNVIWGDEREFCSEFADIFDFEHFKNVLPNDVRVVSSLPSTHLMTKPVEGSPPLHVTPSLIRGRYLKRFNRESFGFKTIKGSYFRSSEASMQGRSNMTYHERKMDGP
ncbi:unnamed protein product [Trifolium pratense]|uniref:Uncharacterized protein n=1 Tax=Trifolium pratense TaxID=57577 RepID=A0ACB0JL40_TRIPR|nr:unnamed protein product [Trifolium pratense]